MKRLIPKQSDQLFYKLQLANAKLGWVQFGGSITAHGSDFSKSATYRTERMPSCSKLHITRQNEEALYTKIEI